MYIYIYIKLHLTKKFAVHERVVIQKFCKKPQVKIKKNCSIVRLKILVSNQLLYMDINVCIAGPLIVRFPFERY